MKPTGGLLVLIDIKIMKIYRIILLLLSAAQLSLSGDTVTAFTEDGREVALFDNGTWLYKPQKNTAEDGSTVNGSTPNASTVKLTNSRGNYVVWYDPTFWERSKDDEDGDMEFFLQLKGEDAYAMTIYERIPIPLQNLKNIALENMKSASESARITEERMVKVNGELLLMLRIEALVEGIPMVYRGYYASGDYGTIQFIAFTHISLEKEYSAAMENLLNGLSVKK
jgi:hypothetical protein